MTMIGTGCRALALLLCLCFGTAAAAPPDAMTFSWTIERGDVDQVRRWLDEGLDPEYQDGQLGSGLMIAAWHGKIDIMALFVERGANPRRVNRNGEQALQLAAWNGNQQAVDWLLAHGAVLNRDGHQWSALHYAVFNGHLALARHLIARGADVNAPSPNASTPLMLAAREGREELIKDLLEAGADVKAKNDWGDTALTFAMRYSRFQIGKMISTPEEFSIAVKAPQQDFGVATRSASAPSEVEALMNSIRAAEGEGRPSEELHQQLRGAVNKLRREPLVQSGNRRAMPLPYVPKTLVITGSRRPAGGERAQMVRSGAAPTPAKAGGAATGKAAISITPVSERATQARIAETMRQIRLAEAQGRPADELRRQLGELVDALPVQ